jgi:hypothetical protein
VGCGHNVQFAVIHLLLNGITFFVSVDLAGKLICSLPHPIVCRILTCYENEVEFCVPAHICDPFCITRKFTQSGNNPCPSLFPCRLSRLVVSCGAVAPLVQMVKAGSHSSKAAAATALRNIAVDAEGQTAVVAGDALPPLCSLVGLDDVACRAAAAKAIANLTSNFSLGGAVVAGGALPHLITAALPSNSGGAEGRELRAAAAEALQNIGANTAARRQVAGTGATSALVAALSGCSDHKAAGPLLRTIGNLSGKS